MPSTVGDPSRDRPVSVPVRLVRVNLPLWTLSARWEHALLAICAIGLGVRLWAVNFGFPYFYHMEEPSYAQAAWDLACHGDLDSPLLQAQTYAGAFLIAVFNSIGAGVSCQAMPGHMPAVYLLLERLISVVAAAATVPILASLGTRLYGRREGLLAALFLAMNFLHVRDAHFGTPDVTATLLITAALLGYARILQGHSARRDYLAAASLTALAVNARPTAVLLLLPFLYAHLQANSVFSRFSPRRVWEALSTPNVRLSLGAFSALVLLLNPQAWVDPVRFLKYWSSFASLGQLGGFGRLQVDALPAPLYYLRVLEWSAGILLVLLMAAGVVQALVRRREGDVLILSFVLAYYGVASLSTVYFARYSLPMIPLLGLLASRFLLSVLPARRLAGWSTVALVVVLAQPVARIARFSYLMVQDDTRTQARAWFEREVPRGAKVAAEWHTPSLDGYNVTVVDFWGLSEKPLQSYVDQGYEYLVVSSFIRDARMVLPMEETHKQEFYQQLRTTMPLEASFSPYVDGAAPPYVIDEVLGPISHLFELERPGPVVEIYRLKPLLSVETPTPVDAPAPNTPRP